MSFDLDTYRNLSAKLADIVTRRYLPRWRGGTLDRMEKGPPPVPSL